MYASTASGGGRGVTSPDSALASDIFDKYCSAVTFKSILSLHRQLCDLLRLKPTYFPHYYPKLKVGGNTRERENLISYWFFPLLVSLYEKT